MMRNEMSYVEWDSYGYDVADNEYYSLKGNVRDIDAIIQELQEIENDFDTHSMNEGILYKEGQLSMLRQVIRYLERV